MKAVIYARYSSDNQREESIEGQIRECAEYAKYNDMEIVGQYIDRAYSAKTDNRPDFQRMIKDSYRKQFDIVLVWKLDRFARDRFDSAYYKRILKKNGARVISAKETISQGAEGILLESMLEGYAEFYSAELAEKTKRGMKENALKCKVNGVVVPLGYMEDSEHRFAIDEAYAPIVREVFALYLDGKGYKQIAQFLAERGVRQKNGKPITPNVVYTMLRNRKYIGEYAKWEFAPATSDEYFSYAAVEGGYMISAKLGETMPAALVIPSEKDGQDVVAIADNAFENQASVTSVLIPDTVTEIGRQAFRNCANLAAVNEGNNIASIAPNAFYGTAWDSNLTGGEVYLGKTLYKYAGGMYTDTEITVKEGTLGIAGNAFNGMDKLVKVTLPAGLTNIGEYAFGGAQTGTGLTEITFPDSVTEIGANAFRNAKSLAKVTIGANVAYIGDNAFGGTAVSNLTYGANAEFGAQGPFRGLTAAATVTLGDNVTAFPAKLFEEWTGLASVSLGGVTQLPANAFDGFENLATVALDDVTVLGDYAFRGTALTEVTIPEGVTSIGNGVFANCTKLAKVNYNAADASAPNSANNAFAGCTALASVVIGEGAAVPDYFFQNLTSLTSADISKAESIGISAFQNTSLTALSTGSVKEIGKSAFQGAKIAELTVGEALESIGYNAFAGNAELTKVIWNATAAETIYEASGAGLVRAIFNDCAKLVTVEVGENVKSLPDYFLPNNTLVTKIDLPAGIESVGDSAFNGCTVLAEISNANKLQTIGQDAFTGTPWFTEYLETDGLVYLGSVLYGGRYGFVLLERIPGERTERSFRYLERRNRFLARSASRRGFLLRQNV